MVVLIDTNVLLDFVLKREPYYKDAEYILEKCASNILHGYIAFHSIPNIFYILRKYTDDITRLKLLKNLCQMVTVTSISHDKVEKALDRIEFKDFEDCLQDECAIEVSADYIITRNIDDFRNSKVRAITPKEFLDIFTK